MRFRRGLNITSFREFLRLDAGQLDYLCSGLFILGLQHQLRSNGVVFHRLKRHHSQLLCHDLLLLEYMSVSHLG